jgi:hypothetical protein
MRISTLQLHPWPPHFKAVNSTFHFAYYPQLPALLHQTRHWSRFLQVFDRIGFNRPRLGTVSINRGLSAPSIRAVRNLVIATFSPLSNSTNVFPGHSLCGISSRVTVSPARSIRSVRISKGWSCNLKRTPFFRSSLRSRSASKESKTNDLRSPWNCLHLTLTLPPPRNTSPEV